MLAGKRKADNSNGKQQPKHNMRDRDPEAGKDQSDQVQHYGQTATAAGGVHGHASKRPEYKTGEFKTLQPERDTDNGETKHKTTNKIEQCGKESPEEQPDQIAKCVHTSNILLTQDAGCAVKISNSKLFQNPISLLPGKACSKIMVQMVLH
jgi:hypothetical protein